MKKFSLLILALALALCLAACAKDTEPPEAASEQNPEPEITQTPESAPPVSADPLKGVYAAGENELYLTNVEFAEEFSDISSGIAHYYPETDTIEIGVKKSTGTHTGAIEGPGLVFTVNLTDGTMISREFFPEPADENFQRVREDDGSLEAISDERLVEIAKTLRAQIGVAPPDPWYK